MFSLPKNFGTPDLDKTVLGEVVDLFTNLDMDETEHNKDILGRTYEYCLAQFAEKRLRQNSLRRSSGLIH